MKHKIIKCKHCKKNLPLYAIVCECGTFTMEYVPTPPNDGSAFYWRHLAKKAECQKRDKKNTKLSEGEGFKQTIKAYSKAIAKDAVMKDYLGRAIAYACIKEFTKAIRDVMKCIELEPKYETAGGLLLMMKAEYKFYKKHLRLKPIVHAMMKKQKIKIEDLEVDEINERLFSFTDSKGKKVIYNMSRDNLLSYDGEAWY